LNGRVGVRRSVLRRGAACDKSLESLRLSDEAGEALLHILHARLQLGIGILPEFHESSEVSNGEGRVSQSEVRRSKSLMG
jgi:hypothetical protein